MKTNIKYFPGFFVLLFIIFFYRITTASFDLTLPMTFHARGEVERLAPKSSTFFVDGNILLSNDMINMKDGDDFDISFYGGVGIWTGMGYVTDNIVFDPRNVHYSLIPGIRAHIADYLATVQLRHDCFHEIDRDEVPTIIWNVFDFQFASLDYLVSNRREKLYADSNPNLRFYPRLYWSLGVGFFPHIPNSNLVFQEAHPFKKVWQVDARFLALRLGNLGWMLDWNPSLWVEKGGKKDWRQYGETGISYFGAGGIMSVYYGHTWKDDQAVQPREGIRALGFRWEL